MDLEGASRNKNLQSWLSGIKPLKLQLWRNEGALLLYWKPRERIISLNKVLASGQCELSDILLCRKVLVQLYRMLHDQPNESGRLTLMHTPCIDEFCYKCQPPGHDGGVFRYTSWIGGVTEVTCCHLTNQKQQQLKSALELCLNGFALPEIEAPCFGLEVDP